MKGRYSVLIVLSVLLLSGCVGKSYKVNKDSLIVRTKMSDGDITHNIRLQVINDRVIYVTATPEEVFSTEASFITNPEITLIEDFMVNENSVSVILSTISLEDRVNKSTGEVSFFDKNGVLILKEKNGGGKSFIPIEVEDTKGYTLHQVFESPDDEAFYGLGQHQSDEFNYKGKNESLYQYNTKVSVPFIVSNKNYGILWDNYSWTKFGDPRNYDELNQDRKSTRLNSSHVRISYAVFCLKNTITINKRHT